MLPALLPESLKDVARQAMYALAPETTAAVMSARARAYSHRLVQEWGLLNLNTKLIDRLGPTVQTALFKGMRLSPMTCQEHLGPFLLGTYEEELHPWLESVVTTRFARVLDIGSKFGYYAVGLARSMPDTDVVAFDTDGWARKAVSEMAAVNKTPRVTVAGFCSASWLDRHLGANSFILSDCEGYERELFARAMTPALESCTLLIEIHEQFAPGVGSALRDRFRRTHTIDSVCSRPRSRPPIDLTFLSDDEVKTAISEIRGPQEWLLLRPKSAASIPTA